MKIDLPPEAVEEIVAACLRQDVVMLAESLNECYDKRERKRIAKLRKATKLLLEYYGG
jgi:hypothetical protein